MNLSRSFLRLLLSAVTLPIWVGCGVETQQSDLNAATPAPQATAPADAAPATPEPAAVADKPSGVVPKDLGASVPAAGSPAAVDGVTLKPSKWTEYLEHVKPKDGKKLTLVDAWATWCAPCKENFPHVVEMHEKYGPKGLQVISLSMDDISDAKAVKEATEFLVSQKAVFTNLLMNEEQDVAFDKLEISAIPSVFLFDAQGKEVHRFTLEDPNDQFTYEQVEQAVQALLEGKPVPSFKKAEARK
jgi:thiol-disulfide isomerase/thioredoxin